VGIARGHPLRAPGPVGLLGATGGPGNATRKRHVWGNQRAAGCDIGMTFGQNRENYENWPSGLARIRGEDSRHFQTFIEAHLSSFLDIFRLRAPRGMFWSLFIVLDVQPRIWSWILGRSSSGPSWNIALAQRYWPKQVDGTYHIAVFPLMCSN
jgi:hypothetical protein